MVDRSLSPIKSARLACVKHAASVRPEPGSNSLVKKFFWPVVSGLFVSFFVSKEFKVFALISLHCSIFKDQSFGRPQVAPYTLVVGNLFPYK